VLAQQLAGRFEEWLDEQTKTRDWSLQAALREWLYDEGVQWSAESYELYLQMVAIVIAAWAERRRNFTYQHADKGEVVLTALSDDWDEGANQTWECLRRDQYDRAAFLDRQRQQGVTEC
jgi:hypothetical protein